MGARQGQSHPKLRATGCAEAERVHQLASGCALTLFPHVSQRPLWSDPLVGAGADLLGGEAKAHSQEELVSQGAALGPNTAKKDQQPQSES